MANDRSWLGADLRKCSSERLVQPGLKTSGIAVPAFFEIASAKPRQAEASCGLVIWLLVTHFRHWLAFGKSLTTPYVLRLPALANR